jgi:hypothetical protein
VPCRQTYQMLCSRYRFVPVDISPPLAPILHQSQCPISNPAHLQNPKAHACQQEPDTDTAAAARTRCSNLATVGIFARPSAASSAERHPIYPSHQVAAPSVQLRHTRNPNGAGDLGICWRSRTASAAQAH